MLAECLQSHAVLLRQWNMWKRDHTETGENGAALDRGLRVPERPSRLLYASQRSRRVRIAWTAASQSRRSSCGDR
jgi:hypothetical protein